VPAEGTRVDGHVVAEKPANATARQNPLDCEIAAVSDIDVLAAPPTRRRFQHASHVPVDAAYEHAYIDRALSSRCGSLIRCLLAVCQIPRYRDAFDRAVGKHGKNIARIIVVRMLVRSPYKVSKDGVRFNQVRAA
jgi:hypothetical protein